ncbi:MAG: hypothetical protein SV062_03845, partial [Thermodesulfobacteriota bacterium]|nr:hypothetical protein [Thermodesulfobacteriota bacterium]
QYPDGTDLDGTGGIPDYSDFSRTVLVENVDDNNYSGSPVPDGTTASKRVVVTVSSAKISDIVIKWVATREGMELMY